MHVELLAPRLNLTEGSFNTAVMCRQRGNSWSNDCHHLLCALPMSIYLQTQQDYSTKNNTFQKKKQQKQDSKSCSDKAAQAGQYWTN